MASLPPHFLEKAFLLLAFSVLQPPRTNSYKHTIVRLGRIPIDNQDQTTHAVDGQARLQIDAKSVLSYWHSSVSEESAAIMSLASLPVELKLRILAR